MRKTLLQLIKREDLAVQKLDDYGKNVEYYALNMAKANLEFAARDYEDAIQKRDAAIQELHKVRMELKGYINDILNEK